MAPPRDVFAALDLENLLHPVRSSDDATLSWAFREVMKPLSRLGPVRAVACLDQRLATRLVRSADALGVRLYPGAVGPDRADGELLDRLLYDVPSSARTVVIGSGDRTFGAAAARLRATGREVIALARPGSVHHDLYRQVNYYLPVSRLASFGITTHTDGSDLAEQLPQMEHRRLLEPA